jgi:hypothetical protein
MILSFGFIPYLIRFWISLMWVWLWYFIQHIHMCLYIFRWFKVVFLSFIKHIDIGVFFHLLVFHWLIIIWRYRLVHKPRLYNFCIIFFLASHRFWTWDFVRLIRYLKSPYSILIFTTLNHRLQLRCIPHPFIWVNIWLHLSPWRSSFIIVPSLKTTNAHFTPYHLLW